jgi:hypothetical protein
MGINSGNKHYFHDANLEPGLTGSNFNKSRVTALLFCHVIQSLDTGPAQNSASAITVKMCLQYNIVYIIAINILRIISLLSICFLNNLQFSLASTLLCEKSGVSIVLLSAVRKKYEGEELFSRRKEYVEPLISFMPFYNSLPEAIFFFTYCRIAFSSFLS